MNLKNIDLFLSALFVIIYGIRLLYQAYLLKHRQKAKKKGEWSELLLVVIPKNILVVITVILIALGLEKNLYFFFGWIIFLVGIIIRFIALKQLGPMYSLNVEIRENHKLIDYGIFSIIRHPLYLAYILDTLGIILFLQKILFLLVLALVIVGVSIRIKNEEKELVTVFGKEYLSYKNRVPGLIPFSKSFDLKKWKIVKKVK